MCDGDRSSQGIPGGAPDAAYRMEEKAALDPAKAHICTMSLSVKEHTGIMIPVAHLIGTNMDTDTFYQFLREFLTDKNNG